MVEESGFHIWDTSFLSKTNERTAVQPQPTVTSIKWPEREVRPRIWGYQAPAFTGRFSNSAQEVELCETRA